jgi:hypothetical protein
MSSSINMIVLRDELNGDKEYKTQLDKEIIAFNKTIMKSIRSAREMASDFVKRLSQRSATER